MAANSAMVCAAPLGPVDCYEWFHEGRAPAELFLEKTPPRRIFFRYYDGHGVVQSESGWHGIWSQDVCMTSRTWRDRQGVSHTQTAGDMEITLDGFRYSGMDAEWTHDNMTFEKKVDDDTWCMTRCGCGTKHRIVFKLKDSAAVRVDPDVREENPYECGREVPPTLPQRRRKATHRILQSVQEELVMQQWIDEVVFQNPSLVQRWIDISKHLMARYQMEVRTMMVQAFNKRPSSLQEHWRPIVQKLAGKYLSRTICQIRVK